MTVANQNYKIINPILKLPSLDSKLHIEVNLISWYDKEPAYDIRKWSDDHEKMSKGITLNEKEYKALMAKLKEEQL